MSGRSGRMSDELLIRASTSATDAAQSALGKSASTHSVPWPRAVAEETGPQGEEMGYASLECQPTDPRPIEVVLSEADRRMYEDKKRDRG